mmetsp:Transcript_111867/g.316041  ORF Transcript_111867/g.316041 Transcript_111867/m.316041 type:complete len:95 (-) Transcript_111867:398-682(-)
MRAAERSSPGRSKAAARSLRQRRCPPIRWQWLQAQPATWPVGQALPVELVADGCSSPTQRPPPHRMARSLAKKDAAPSVVAPALASVLRWSRRS